MTKEQLLESLFYFADLLGVKDSIRKMIESNLGLVRIVEVIILNCYSQNIIMKEHEQNERILEYYNALKSQGFYEFR